MSLDKNGPKIVIIGAGSLFFGRKLIWSMNCLEGLQNGHLGLVDTDPEHLRLMRELAEKSRAASGAGFTISASTDFRDILHGADFVILSFSDRNAHFRGVDCQISAKHGIRMCSGDTIGPGGVFRALRELPKIQEIAEAVEDLCPRAWLINYINPSAVIGIFLQKHARTRNLALCDSLHLPHLHRSYMQAIGLDPADEKRFSMRIAGVNHFTFCLSAEYRGEDVLSRIVEALRTLGSREDPNDNAKSLFNRKISAHLADIFGAMPVCTAHTKEYLPYFQGWGAHVEAEIVPPLSLFEADMRQAQTDAMWDEIRALVEGRNPITDFLDKTGSDHATELVQALWLGSGRHLFVNVPNRGAVPNLPDDALLELECVCDHTGARPLPVGDFPLGLRSLQMRILDTHELTVEAYVRKDRNLLLRALAVDPIVNSIATAEAVLDDIYEAEKDCLPEWVGIKTSRINNRLDRVVDSVHQGQTSF
jgi:alpha-galactosidase